MKAIDFKYKVYALADFLVMVKHQEERSTNYDPTFCYALYSKTDVVALHDEVYIGDPVDFDEDDHEVFPPFVVENDFQYYCSDENIQDVVDHAAAIHSEATNQLLLDSLEYYLAHDTFLA